MDMLVKLYNLPQEWGFLDEQQRLGVTVRKPIGPERHFVVNWVREHFMEIWASEADIALSRWPVSCFIATYQSELVGFACYDATALGFFGPTGVLEQHRGRGTGKALLLACMLDMRLKGYGYAIIGGAGPTEFYSQALGAVEIPGSESSIWDGMLGG
jgi:GNAT superfamily N-acetyltransferase